jgi:non-specific serine/threonine protein kinase
MILYFAGDLRRARTHFERSAATAREIGDHWRFAEAYFGLAQVAHVTGDLDIAWDLYQESLTVHRANGNRMGEGAVLNHRGHLASLRGDEPLARRLLRESLLASRAGQARRRLGFTLSAVAGLMARAGDAGRAVTIDTAGRASLAALGAQLAPPMRALYDEPLTDARAALTDEQIGQAETKGRALSLDQAVADALAWLDRPSTGLRDARTASIESAAPRTTHDGVAPLVVPSVTPTEEHDPGRRTTPAARPENPLTPRERDVATLVARGYTNRQIAEALVVTEGTAANYVQRVMYRLSIHNRAQIAAWAVAHHLLGPESVGPGSVEDQAR